MTRPTTATSQKRQQGSLTDARDDVMIKRKVDSAHGGRTAFTGANPAPLHLVSDMGPVGSGPEVACGNDDGTSLILCLPVVDLHSAITTPEGGPLKLATTGQVLTLSSLDRACLSARVASDNKARDILVLDMRKITPLYDFLVLATGSSRRQIHTITEEIDATMREHGDRRLSVEGYEASTWVVQDYGDVMVHVFNPQTREYYGLEELWADAPRIDWESHDIEEYS